MTKPFTSRRDIAIAAGVLLLLVLVLLVNAWVVDDAYITFRTVDNFTHGYGLTWNPDERVQAYTHPLWMLIVSLFCFLTSEFFFTTIVLSCFLTIAAVLVAWAAVTDRFRSSRWKGYLLVLTLLSSKAAMDYASSGLENCFSYLIAAAFLWNFTRLCEAQEVASKNVAISFFLASLAFLNRTDTLLLYFPALLYLLYLSRHAPKRHLARVILVATLPATMWILFSLVYYGYPFPNTAYAKVLSTGFPFAWKFHRGIQYLTNSVLWDSASYVIVVCALWFSLRNRSAAALSVLVGIGLYLIFVVCSAASATHMSGRFFAVPFFMAIIVFVNGAPDRRFGIVACACLAVYMAWSPVSAIKFGTPLYQAYPQNRNFIDAKRFVLNEGAALLNWRPGKRMPDHDWYHYGEMLRSRPEKVHLGGAHGGEAIGYTGFAAGPTKYLIDRVGLGDPLLARLPAYRPPHISDWKSGHFHRRIPAGYKETLEAGENLIREADVARYYDLVRTITRGPIFRWERFKVILNMNLGRYDYLLDQAGQGASGDTDEPRP